MTLFNSCKVIAWTTEANTKPKIYHFLRYANQLVQLVLNCKIITQNTFHNMNLYWEHSLGKREGVDEESNKKWHRKEGVQLKKWCPSHNFFCVLFSVTQSLFLLGFSSSTDNITARNKRSISKKVSTSISEITIKYLLKNIIIPPLCQCGLFIQNVCLKIQLRPKMWFFTSFDITWQVEASFLSLYSFLFRFDEKHRESVKVKLTKYDRVE